MAGAEIELKFQLPAESVAAAERALSTRSAERVRLQAMYFDTPDRRLAGAGMALRLRQEGERWVQTLKGRGDGLMHRLEDEVPVVARGATAATLDLDRHDGTAAGRALARLLSDGAKPELLFVTDIQRLRRVLRSGGTRIEVALDRGEIRAGLRSATVCELEFEWLGGPLEGLISLATRWAVQHRLVLDVTTKAERGHRLLAGDAPPPAVRAAQPALQRDMTLNQARGAMVAAALQHALPNAAAITGGSFEPDHVHQLRVALRRLRTALRAFGPADAARDASLATVFLALGRRRDADVLAHMLEPAWAAAAAAGWVHVQPAPVGAAVDTSARALRDPATTALWLGLIGLANGEDSDADDPAWADAAGPVVRRWRRRARRLARDWSALDDPSRHRLRKQLKRLRYLLEFCECLWPGKAIRTQLAALRPLQDTLGHWNDLVVARAHLAALPSPDPAALFAAGWLAREALACERDCVAAASAWRATKAPGRIRSRRVNGHRKGRG